MITKKGGIAVLIIVVVNLLLIFIPATTHLWWLWITAMIFLSIGALFIDHVSSTTYPTTAIMLFEDEADCEDDFCPRDD